VRAPAWAAPFAIVVTSAVHAADAPPPAALSPSDRDALLTAACSWSEGTRAELSKQRCAAPSDLVRANGSSRSAARASAAARA
jgi:hypothetical protein